MDGLVPELQRVDRPFAAVGLLLFLEGTLTKEVFRDNQSEIAGVSDLCALVPLVFPKVCAVI